MTSACDQCHSFSQRALFLLALPLPAVVAKLRVALILGQESASEVIVGVEQWSKGNKECAEDQRPNQVLTKGAVHFAHKLCEVVVVLKIVAQAGQRTAGKASINRHKTWQPG